MSQFTIKDRSNVDQQVQRNRATSIGETSFGRTFGLSAESAYLEDWIVNLKEKAADVITDAPELDSDQLREQFPNEDEEFYKEPKTARQAKSIHDQLVAQEELQLALSSRGSGVLSSMGYLLLGGLTAPTNILSIAAGFAAGPLITGVASRIASTTSKIPMATRLAKLAQRGMQYYNKAPRFAQHMANNLAENIAGITAVELPAYFAQKGYSINDNVGSQMALTLTLGAGFGAFTYPLSRSGSVVDNAVVERLKPLDDGIVRARTQIYNDPQVLKSVKGKAYVIRDETRGFVDSLEPKYLGDTTWTGYSNPNVANNAALKLDSPDYKVFELDTDKLNLAHDRTNIDYFEGKELKEVLSDIRKVTKADEASKLQDRLSRSLKDQGYDGMSYKAADNGLEAVHIFDESDFAIRPMGQELAIVPTKKQKLYTEGVQVNGKTMRIMEDGYVESNPLVMTYDDMPLDDLRYKIDSKQQAEIMARPNDFDAVASEYPDLLGRQKEFVEFQDTMNRLQVDETLAKKPKIPEPLEVPKTKAGRLKIERDFDSIRPIETSKDIDLEDTRIPLTDSKFDAEVERFAKDKKKVIAKPLKELQKTSESIKDTIDKLKKPQLTKLIKSIEEMKVQIDQRQVLSALTPEQIEVKADAVIKDSSKLDDLLREVEAVVKDSDDIKALSRDYQNVKRDAIVDDMKIAIEKLENLSPEKMYEIHKAAAVCVKLRG